MQLKKNKENTLDVQLTPLNNHILVLYQAKGPLHTFLTNRLSVLNNFEARYAQYVRICTMFEIMGITQFD